MSVKVLRAKIPMYSSLSTDFLKDEDSNALMQVNLLGKDDFAWSTDTGGFAVGGSLLIANDTFSASLGADSILEGLAATTKVNFGGVTILEGAAAFVTVGDSGKTMSVRSSELQLVGGGDKIGFFGGVPAIKPIGVAVTDVAIHAALVSVGLIAA